MCLASIDRFRGDFVWRFLLSTLIIMSCGFSGPSQAVADERLIAVIMANSQPRYNQVHAAFVKNTEGF